MVAASVHSPSLGRTLEARGLRFGYGPALVLDGLDLALAPGQMTALMGPNGCGKSTLLGLLAGLLRPQAGAALLGEKAVSSFRRRELAALLSLVPQSLELAPGLSALETVLSGRFVHLEGRMFESEDDLAAARQALDLTGLGLLAQRPAGTLSGGERQRLALARALAAGAGWLLLDEPTSALDPEHQLKVMGLLERLCHEQGRSVCLASHDLNLASLFCDRLALLGRGRVLAVGRPEEVLRPELLAQAYGVEAVVDEEPSRGRPRVSLVAPKA